MIARLAANGRTASTPANARTASTPARSRIARLAANGRTASTVARARTARTAARGSAARRSGPGGFAAVLRAEWTKFVTVRGWLTGMVIAALVMVALGLLTGGSFSCHHAGPHGGACVHQVTLGPGGEPVNDSFYFVRQPLTGNGSITVRVTSLTGLIPGQSGSGIPAAGTGGQPDLREGLQPWSKAGIIVKASTRQGSSYAAMMITGGHGVRMQYDYTQDTAGLPGAVSVAAPRWLRLTRAADTLTGYQSADGTHWARVGAVTFARLPSTVQAGLFAASPDYSVTTQGVGSTSSASGPTTATARFDHLSMTGARPGTGWAGVAVGGATGGPARTGFRQASGTFTVTGTGDIAPIVGQTGVPSRTIERDLVGAFAGLIAITVIAALFITAEYRRGLIRTTLAASPRRGQVLAAKAIVVAVAAFVTGLAAAVVAVAAGNPIARSQGFYLFPVTDLTMLRVIAGTAAVLAIAAVLALALGTILRRSAVTVTVVIVAVVLPYLLAVAQIVPAAPADWLLRVTPAAGFAIQQSVPQYPQVDTLYTPSGGFFPLAPWAGFAVLCGYAAIALCAAFFVLRRRDA